MTDERSDPARQGLRVTESRAGLVIGGGSASSDVVHDLTERAEPLTFEEMMEGYAEVREPVAG